MNHKLSLVLVASFALLFSCQSKKDKLEGAIETILSRQEGNFAVAFRDLATGEELLVNEHESFHAASTMKTPVMIEVYKQAAEGKFLLTDSIVIKNEFKSIVDGSPYGLTKADDSEPEIYKKLGQKSSIMDLMYGMITASSNLATNILIELVDAKKVTQTMRDFGAKDIQILRGVEDQKAYDNGLSNSVTAYDLMLIFEKIAKGEAVDKKSSQAMIDILLDQKFNDIIPAKLPKDVRVSHKTGWIKGLHHDSGIVFLPSGKSYILILLSKNLNDEAKGIDAMADVSKLIYEYEEVTRK
jgi:beta-lactamase class A